MDWIHQSFVNDQLCMDFSNAIHSGRRPIDVAIDAVHRISKAYPPPYTLFASGGIDSQAMIYAWLKSGISFSIKSVKFENNFNEHDLEELKIFSFLNGVDVTYHDFNILDFLENRLESFVMKTECTSPQICAHMAFTESIDNGTVIFSGNPLMPDSAFLNYTIFGLNRYAKKYRTNMIPFFFMHDPELAVSFLPIIDSINSGIRNNSVSAVGYRFKYLMYMLGGFLVIPQKEKYTGFEQIKNYFDSRTDLVTRSDRLEFSRMPSHRVFDILYRYKWTRQIKYNDMIIFKNIRPSRIAQSLNPIADK